MTSGSNSTIGSDIEPGYIELYRSGELKRRVEALEEDENHPRARLRLAELMLARGNIEEAGELVTDIPGETTEHHAAQAVLAMVNFGRECVRVGGLAAAKKKTKAKPRDPAAIYCLASCLAAGGDYPAALDEFLKIVEMKKDYKEGAAREAMVHIFALLGDNSPVTREYRKKLSGVLY